MTARRKRRERRSSSSQSSDVGGDGVAERRHRDHLLAQLGRPRCRANRVRHGPTAPPRPVRALRSAPRGGHLRAPRRRARAPARGCARRGRAGPGRGSPRAPVHAFPADPLAGGPGAADHGHPRARGSDTGRHARPNLETHATDGPLDVLLMPGLAFEARARGSGAAAGSNAFLAFCRARLRAGGRGRPGGPRSARRFCVGQVPVGSADRNVDALVTARGGVVHPEGARACAKPRR